jgi:hypothetical protein
MSNENERFILEKSASSRKNDDKNELSIPNKTKEIKSAIKTNLPLISS